MWQEVINRAYEHIISSARDNDINKFHFFLTNFGAWKKYTGIEASELFYNAKTSLVKTLYLKNTSFYNQLKLWRWFYNDRKPLSELTYPTHGNQCGAFIDGTFLGAGSFFNDIYGSILNGLINDIEHPIIAEIGGGYGKLAYFLLRNIENFTYIDFDLPEVLCLASYYLMKIYPQKKGLLYGEEKYSESLHSKYDLIFMPNWEIEKIGASTIDLFVNKNSLGEVNSEAANNYVRFIAAATRKYFFHMNHEIVRNTYSDGKQGLLGYEYPLPHHLFRLLMRYPDLGHALYNNGRLDFNSDIFLYLYERKK